MYRETCTVLFMTNRDFDAEYRTARLAYQNPKATSAEIDAAVKESRKIERAADKANVHLDCIGIDEQARKEMWGK